MKIGMDKIVIIFDVRTLFSGLVLRRIQSSLVLSVSVAKHKSPPLWCSTCFYLQSVCERGESEAEREREEEKESKTCSPETLNRPVSWCGSFVTIRIKYSMRLWYKAFSFAWWINWQSHQKKRKYIHIPEGSCGLLHASWSTVYVHARDTGGKTKD